MNRIHLRPFIRLTTNDGPKHHELLTRAQSVGMRSGFVNLQAGQNVGSHSTCGNEEFLVVLDGSGEVDLEGLGRQRIQKGCIAYIPPHTLHDVFNTSSEPLRYVYVVSRCGK